jgi:hypothetical protein
VSAISELVIGVIYFSMVFGALLEWLPIDVACIYSLTDKEMASSGRDDRTSLFRHVQQFANSL